MTVKELKEILVQYPDELEIMTKKNDICGNIGEIHSVNKSSYGFFGKEIPCIILEDWNVIKKGVFSWVI